MLDTQSLTRLQVIEQTLAQHRKQNNQPLPEPLNQQLLDLVENKAIQPDRIQQIIDTIKQTELASLYQQAFANITAQSNTRKGPPPAPRSPEDTRNSQEIANCLNAINEHIPSEKASNPSPQKQPTLQALLSPITSLFTRSSSR